MNDTYRDYLKSDDWNKKRAKKRCGRRCAICAAETGLDVHHLSYKADLTEVEQKDLRVLCRRCHDTAHDLIRAGTLTFTNSNHHHRFARTKAAVKKALGITNVNMFRAKR